MSWNQDRYGSSQQTPGDYVLRLGKFKGAKLRDIGDLTYLDWLLGQNWIREDLKKALQQWLNIPTNRRELEEQLEARSRR